MNNDMKLYSSMNYPETDEVMRNALKLIAKEVQRFRLEFEAGQQKIYKNNEDINVLEKENNEDIDELEKENSYPAKLRKKNKQLKKLKENLNTICNVAKIVLSAKNRETELLMGHLNKIRNESLDIRKSNSQNISIIHKLRIENHNINNDVQFLCNFIHLAYEKLRKMRNETPKYMPCIEELKAILLACGQYYADYTNARDRCDQLEQKNRFMKNKLNIVENNLKATTEELRNLRSQNTKLRIKLELNRKNRLAITGSGETKNISEMLLDKLLDDRIRSHCDNTAIPSTNQYKLTQEIPNRSRYLTSHLETVKNLILDQDNMLKELKALYLEVLIPES